MSGPLARGATLAKRLAALPDAPPSYGAAPLGAVTADQMRRAEAWAFERQLPGPALMEIAGRAVADALAACLEPGSRVVVLVGPGNNGGDGLVAARHLHDAGHRVTVYAIGRKPDPDAKLALLDQRGCRVVAAGDDPGGLALGQAAADADVALDALLGTGRARPIAGEMARALESLARSDVPVVALDVPSGLDADTGAVDERTPRCVGTLTLGLPKRGLFLEPGGVHAGVTRVLDIGLPLAAATGADAEVATARWIGSLLPRRPVTGHKGTFGRVLVLAGARQYSGAPVLTALAAARGGAGLVTLGTAASLVEQLAGRAIETTFLPLPETADGAIAAAAVDLVAEVLGRYQAVAVGPGLGTAPETRAFLLGLLERLRGGDGPPLAIDADGLNILSREPEWWRLVPGEALLTPHPLEMARLLGVERIDADRIVVARDAAERWGCHVVLKGAWTVVASPGRPPTISPLAVPALGTAGSGDVLTGAITSLLAQRLPVAEAARVGVYLHARAGELAGAAMPAGGALAGDLLERLPLARAALTGGC